MNVNRYRLYIKILCYTDTVSDMKYRKFLILLTPGYCMLSLCVWGNVVVSSAAHIEVVVVRKPSPLDHPRLSS